MVVGVSEGYKELELVGVGYRANQGNIIELSLGYTAVFSCSYLLKSKWKLSLREIKTLSYHLRIV